MANGRPPTAPYQQQLHSGFLGPLYDMTTQWKSFVLPVTVLVCLTVGGFSRFMRGSVLDALVQDYVRTARAKGASSRRVLYKHTLRNAVIPIITILGLTLPALFAGALITETLFNYSGMGLLTVNAVLNSNIPLVMGTTLLIAILTIFGNFLADILVAGVDPRVRLLKTGH